MKDQELRVRIDKNKHSVLFFYCKCKGISMKEYINQRISSDQNLSNFQKTMLKNRFS